MNTHQHLSIPHEWLFPASLQEATIIQRQLAARVVEQDDFSTLTTVAGMDVSNNPRDPQQLIHASMVVLNPHTLQIQTTASLTQVQKFPYISGFLGFREAPALVQAFQQVQQRPALILVDGHGVSHPRGLGIASHIGVLVDCPTIGVAKSLLIGKPVGELGTNPGDTVPVQWRGKTIAMLLRSKLRSNPLIISCGHRVSLTTAVRLVQEYLRGYRLPEPTRQAHLAANAQRKQAQYALPSLAPARELS